MNFGSFPDLYFFVWFRFGCGIWFKKYSNRSVIFEFEYGLNLAILVFGLDQITMLDILFLI